MTPRILELLQTQIPLPAAIADKRANCFNAVQLFWNDIDVCIFTGPADFIAYLDSNFRQLGHEETQLPLDTYVIWSRSANILPNGEIRIDALNRRDDGYPFGLIIEHAFVGVDSATAFQKRDPSAMGPYELISQIQAIQPYLDRNGFEITRHRRK